jgi:hypothetical protein
VIAWSASLFTGRYARDLFAFVPGVGRWSVRVSAPRDASSVSDEGTPRPSAI